MRKLLRCRNSSSTINDLTVGNNEAVAIILINTRVIGQQARSYDIGINTLAHEFALETTLIFADTYTGDIQSKTKKISQTEVCGANKKKIICSLSDDSICHFIYWSTNDPSKYNVDNFQTNPKVKDVTWYLVDKISAQQCHKTCNYCSHKVLYRQ